MLSTTNFPIEIRRGHTEYAEEERRYLPSTIVTGSLHNKMEKLAAVARNRRDICECGAMCLPETWLKKDTVDPIATMDGFQPVQLERK